MRPVRGAGVDADRGREYIAGKCAQVGRLRLVRQMLHRVETSRGVDEDPVALDRDGNGRHLQFAARAEEIGAVREQPVEPFGHRPGAAYLPGGPSLQDQPWPLGHRLRAYPCPVQLSRRDSI